MEKEKLITTGGSRRNLKFPYLIPFSEGKKIHVLDVDNIDGFRGSSKLSSWSATGFYAKQGDNIFASRTGVVVEVAGAQRSEDAQNWYNGWNNNITILQPDGTLMCYRNVVDKQKKLKLGQTIYAGQLIGQVAPASNNIMLLIYHDSLITKGLTFIIPQFVVDVGKTGIVNSTTEYMVVHPADIRGLEMSKKERKKILGVKK